MKTLFFCAAVLAAAASRAAAAPLDVCADLAAPDLPYPAAESTRILDAIMARTRAPGYKTPIARKTLETPAELRAWGRLFPDRVLAPGLEALRSGPADVSLYVTQAPALVAYLYSEAERRAASDCAAYRGALARAGEFGAFARETGAAAADGAGEDAAKARAAWLASYDSYRAARGYLNTLSLPYPNPFAKFRPGWEYRLDFAPAAPAQKK